MPDWFNPPVIEIKIAGQVFNGTDMDSLIECTVEQAMGAPDVITMRFDDPSLAVANNSAYALGAAVEVKLAFAEQTAATITEGEIFSIESNLGYGQRLETVIRAFHKFNRLNHGRNTRSFVDQKDSDFVSTIAQAHGLSTSIDATTASYPYMVQWNQTDMEFLRERAQRIGYLLYTDATKLYFKKYDIATEPVMTLSLDDNLLGFRPRLSLAQQVSKVEVRKWDVKTKDLVAGVNSAPNDTKQGGASMNGAAALESAYGAKVLTIVDPTALDQSDAEAVANGYVAQRTRQYTEAEALCPGSELLRPGAVIKIDNVGSRFSGNYMITSARHVCVGGGYTTWVTMTGGYPERIGDMLGAETHTGKAFGVLPGVVTNLNDQENAGRIKVAFKQMPPNAGVDLESGWMRLATPMSGNGRGFQFYPEVGDEVLVAFDSGEPSQGFIIGSLWNGVDKAPLADSEYRDSSAVKKRAFKSNAGHEIIFGEDDSDTSVTIKDKEGNTVLLDAKNKMVKITAIKDMQIDVSGDLTIKATKNISIEATQNLTMKATQNVEISATQNATLKATAQVSVEGTAGATVKSNATLQLSGTAMAELKGAIVKIN